MGNVFAEAMQSSDASSLSLLLQELQPDSHDLSTWINGPHQPTMLPQVLQLLPNDTLIDLYKRLFETVEGKPAWLGTLVRFILEHPQRNHLPSLIEELALSILSSAVTCEEQHIAGLSLCIKTESLVTLVFKLRAQAAACCSTGNNREQARLNIWQSHYDSLTTCLTVRATTAAHDYQRLIASNDELANLLMSKRIKTLPGVQDKIKLCEELLANPHAYNWLDRAFKNLIADQLLTQIAAAATDKRQALFEHYAPDDTIHFLSHFCEQDDQLLSLLKDHDDPDKALTINFITQNHGKNPELTGKLFRRFDGYRLISLCAHILALHDGNDTLLDRYGRALGQIIECSADAQDLLTCWANTLSELPADRQKERDELIDASLRHVHSKPALQLALMTALLTAFDSIEPLLPHYQYLLNNLPAADKTRLLQALAPDRLLSLFVSIARQPAVQAYVILFTDRSNQANLQYLLLNTPVSDPDFLVQIVPLIDEHQLVALIDQLMDSYDADPAYHYALDSILLRLSHTLMYNSMKTEHSSHAWVNTKNAARIAERLLSIPDCFQNLAIRSTVAGNYMPGMLQGVAVHGTATDLKLRASRVFAQATYDDKSIHNIALRLLSHFRNTPKRLHEIFVNLRDASPSFNAEGKHYYQQLLKACWQILKPSAEAFQEAACIQLLTGQLKQKHSFDYLIAHLLSNVRLNNDTLQSAHYLTQIQAETLEAIPEPTLANILLDSEQNNTAGNWAKVSDYLNQRPLPLSLSFARTLIEQTRARQNPPALCEKTRQLILNLTHFRQFLPQLTDRDIHWLLQQCSPEQRQTCFPEWLSILIEHHRFHPDKAADLLGLLPPDPMYFDSLYRNQQDEFEALLHPILISMAQQGQSHTAHFIALLSPVQLQSDAQKRKFLTEAQHRMPACSAPVATVLNMLLLSLDDLSAHDINNQMLVNEHLNFFARLADNPDLHQTLEQLALNTFLVLSNRSPDWRQSLLSNPVFTNATLFWLATIPENVIARHPFASILMDNADVNLAASLVNSPPFQRFVRSLLSAPPASMNAGQFQLLFAKLKPGLKQELAQDILQRPSLEDVQWFSLITLSRALPIDTLFHIFEHSKTRFIFIDLLFHHPEGIDHLSVEQKDALLQHLESAKQVLRILDSESSPELKQAFVHSLFQFFKRKQINILTWMRDMRVDAKTLAALANFTVSPEHKVIFQDALASQTWRQQDLQDYLRAPSVDLPTVPYSLLGDWIRDTWRHPERGQSCHLSLFASLDSVSAHQALLAQFRYLQDIHQLADFYRPLAGCQETADDMLSAARWIQRLPVLADASKAAQERHTQQLQTMAHVSPQPLVQLFCPGTQARSSALSAKEANYLANAPQHHQQSLQDKGIDPVDDLKKILACARQHISLELLTDVLLSPLTQNWSAAERYDLISLWQLIDFTKEIDAFHRALQLCANANKQNKIPFKILTSLAETSLPVLVNSLFQLDPQTLTDCQQTCHLLQLPCLHALLSLIKTAKRAHQSAEHILSLFPNSKPGLHFEMDWFSAELRAMDACRDALMARSITLVTDSLLYRCDPYDNERLIRVLRHQTLCDLTPCLNSYLPAFVDKNTVIMNKVLETLAQLFANPERLDLLSRQLDPALLEQVLRTALQNPKDHEALIRQISLIGKDGKYPGMVQKHFMQRLAPLPSKPQSLAQFTGKDLAALSESETQAILIIQRILYYQTPMDELLEWRRKGNEISEESRRAFFCADASLLAALKRMENSPLATDLNSISEQYVRQAMAGCLTFFRENSHALSYCTSGEKMLAAPPMARFHYQFVLAFIADKYDDFLSAFMQQVPDHKQRIELERWLAVLLDQKVFPVLCDSLLKKPLSSFEQEDWLLSTSLRLCPHNEQIIQNISRACSWTWLRQHIHDNNTHRLVWLRLALNNAVHNKAILRDETSRQAFLALLGHCRFPLNELISLCELKINPALKTLLATHVINREDYLARLEGSSLLNDLSDHSEQRLKPVAQRIDLTHLPDKVLKNCLPEAAATLLCVVRQFHMLHAGRLLPLLSALGAQRNAFIVWWITHYAAMPGADTPLLVLAQQEPKLFLSALAQMLPKKRHVLFRLLIQQTTDSAFAEFAHYATDADLQYAMLRFWHGKQQDEALITKIHALIRCVCQSPDSLSLNSIQLLVKLGEIPAFQAVHALIKQASGDHLKHHAEQGNCSIFYDNGQINQQRLLRPIHLQAEPAAANPVSQGRLQKVGAVLAYLLPLPSLSAAKQDEPTVEDAPAPADNISAINYFLMHFKGDNNSLAACLQQYFQGFAAIEDEANIPPTLLLTASLLNRDDLDNGTRRAIFNSLLLYPCLLKGLIAAHVLQFDTAGLLKHVGRRKDYQLVQQIASSALAADTGTDRIISNANGIEAQRAMAEARFESALQQVSGLFSGLRIWFRRCNFYGWSGFFRPNQPEYMASFDSPVAAETGNSSAIALQALQHPAPTIMPVPTLNKLPANNASLSAWTAWYEALCIYNSQDQDNEQVQRPLIDSAFQHLFQRTQSLGYEHELSIWFRKHQQEFKLNRRRLLDIYQQNGSEDQQTLLSLACKGPGAFDGLDREWKEPEPLCLLPEEQVNPTATQPTSFLGGLVNGAASSLSFLGKGVGYLLPHSNQPASSSNAITPG